MKKDDIPAVQVTYDEPKTGGPPSPRLPALGGLIETVTVEPSGTPRSFFEQFRIFEGFLCWYDTLTNNWHSSAEGGFGGVESFTDLDDVPSSYSGEGGKIPMVNDAESGLIFVNANDPGGSDQYAQFNDGGVFGAVQEWLFDKSSATMILKQVGDLSKYLFMRVSSAVAIFVTSSGVPIEISTGSTSGTPADIKLSPGGDTGSNDRGNVVIRSPGATSANKGFLVVGIQSGTPTGTATNGAMVWDTSANKLWVYNTGWKSVTLS